MTVSSEFEKTSPMYWIPSWGCGHSATSHTQLQTWEEFINNIPKKQKWVFQHLTLADKGKPIIQAITSRHTMRVSHGSFKDGQGTAAWMIYDTQQPQVSLGQGVITTPGSTKAQGSYQSKLAGIYGIVITINALVKYHGKSQGSILIICDGEVALTKSMQPWMSNPLEKHFNIIHMIWVGLRASKLQWTSKHIKRHHTEEALALSNKARWNDMMDKWQINIGFRYKPVPAVNSLLGELWELWINNKKVSTEVKNSY